MHRNPCTYDFCVRLDALAEGRRIYPALMHAALVAVNSIREARMDFDVCGRPGFRNRMHASFTHMEKDGDRFRELFLGFKEDRDEFSRDYARSVLVCDPPEDGMPKNVVCFSIPPSEGGIPVPEADLHVRQVLHGSRRKDEDFRLSACAPRRARRPTRIDARLEDGGRAVAIALWPVISFVRARAASPPSQDTI